MRVQDCYYGGGSCIVTRSENLINVDYDNDTSGDVAGEEEEEDGGDVDDGGACTQHALLLLAYLSPFSPANEVLKERHF